MKRGRFLEGVKVRKRFNCTLSLTNVSGKFHHLRERDAFLARPVEQE